MADPSSFSSSESSTESSIESKRFFDAVLFDLDGTILDTLPDLVVLTNMALEQAGYPQHNEEEIKSYVGNGVRALMYQAVPAGTSEEDAERAMRQWKELFPVYPNDLTHPYPHIVTMLRDLQKRGCKLGVLSNKFDEGTQQIINQCLPNLFDVVHGECDDFPRKPDPCGLLRTMDELEVTPERTVYVGDSPGDVITARKVGVYAVGVSWGYHNVQDFAEADATPDLMIDSPLDLVKLIDDGDDCFHGTVGGSCDAHERDIF